MIVLFVSVLISCIFILSIYKEEKISIANQFIRKNLIESVNLSYTRLTEILFQPKFSLFSFGLNELGGFSFYSTS